ncbi:MAG: tyrosine-protein phosphatase [Microbacteriaceae bacterium]
MKIGESFMLQGSFNVRGLGARSGFPWVFRSAALDDATAADFEKLAEIGITKVIDLRSKTERGPVRHPFQLSVLPLYGEDQGPPANGDLENIYRSILSTSGQEIAEAGHIIAQNDGLTLVHCKVGKDRTGLVIAVVAIAAGVPEDEVIEDYTISAAEVRKNREAEVLAQLETLGLSELEFEKSLQLHLDSPGSAIKHTIDWLTETFGSVTEYLRKNGLSDEDIAKLHEKYQNGVAGTVQISDSAVSQDQLGTEARRGGGER